MRKIISPDNKKLVSFSLIIAAFSFIFYAYEDGITGKTLKSSEPGCTCHSEVNSPQVNVVIEGPDILKTGETGDYTIRISGGPLVRGGTNIATSAGNLHPGEGMQKIGAELTHTMPKEPEGGEVVFNFTYTAPNIPASVTLYANGNSVNYSGTEYGDAWNFAESKIIIVDAVSSSVDNTKADDFYLEQNYPNPFNPSTTIKYKIPFESSVKLKVYNLLGEEVKTIVDDFQSPGEYKVSFDAGSLASGYYVYSLYVNNKIHSNKKMILLK